MEAHSKFICSLCDKQYDFKSRYDRHLTSAGRDVNLALWRYNESHWHIISASKEKPAPEIRLGSARPASSVGKHARPARVYTSAYYPKFY